MRSIDVVLLKWMMNRTSDVLMQLAEQLGYINNIDITHVTSLYFPCDIDLTT